jgi:UDP-N-acetylglucosamine 2-epimerase (non-hydrolysing)
VIRVLTVFGTRPEAIKFAPVLRALEADSKRFESLVCVSAQHRQMLDQVLGTFGLSADFDLDLMQQAQSPADVAGAILKTLPDIIRRTDPDLLLVQGDTATTFAAAFAAYLNRVPVGHVEAGLRTGNLDHPFPEEMNRILTTRVATLHFAPTQSAQAALLAEGVAAKDVFVTGNTVIDALLGTIDPGHVFDAPELSALTADDPVILITTHRRESFGEPMENACRAIRSLAGTYASHRFVIPVHPNPNVRDPVQRMLGDIPNVILCAPLAYRDFVNLMGRSRLILTDSGGVQEEAPSLDVPVLVMRKTTERPEGVASGCAKLVGTDTDSIVRAATDLLEDEDRHAAMARVDNPYGDGSAAGRIVDVIATRIKPRMSKRA